MGLFGKSELETTNKTLTPRLLCGSLDKQEIPYKEDTIMPKTSIAKLLEDHNSAVKKAAQLKLDIDKKQRKLERLNTKADTLSGKIRELRKPTSGKPAMQEIKPNKSGKVEPGESLTDSLLELCQSPLSRSEILEKLGTKFKPASVDSTLSTLKHKGSKGRKLLYKNGKYQVGKAVAVVKGKAGGKKKTLVKGKPETGA